MIRAIRVLADDISHTFASFYRMASIVFVKRGAVVEAEKPIVQQVRVISLSDGSPYETLHSYVSAAVAPYFKSFVRESGKADRDGDKVRLVPVA